jgi:hypothetical protein
MKTWLASDTARVQTPRYVRDTIHVSLLAKAYAAFVGGDPAPGTVQRLNPSGYPESRGGFAGRVRREAVARLGRSCMLELTGQTDFLDGGALRWSEVRA